MQPGRRAFRARALSITIAVGGVDLACEWPRPSTTESATVPEASPSRTREVPEPAPAPLSASDRWLVAEAELRASGAARRSDGDEAELRTRALAALEALPDAEPRTVEFLCRAALEPWFVGERSDALLVRAAELAARPRTADPRERYASLLRDTIRLYNHYWFPSMESLRVRRIERQYPLVDVPQVTSEDCATADWAALRMELLHRVPGTRRSYEALYAEVERALGADDPALATVLDRGYGVCDQNVANAACMSDRRRFERALDLRERGLGHDHPLTHASRLNLAMILLEQGDRRRAEALLAVVARARTPDKSTVLALRELAMGHGRRGGWGAAAEALAEASRLAHELLDPARDRALIHETQILYAHAAAYRGDYRGAEAAFLRAQAEDPRGADPRTYSYHLAEVLRAAGRYEEALARYDAWIDAWLADRNWQSHTVSQLEAVLRGRAAALKRMGRGEEARRDLARARALKARGIRALYDPDFGDLSVRS